MTAGSPGKQIAADIHGPGLESLLHPVPVVALVSVVVNDHLLKAYHPVWFSGKLSDVAVLALLPFLFVAMADLVRYRWPGLPAPGRLALLGSVTLSSTAFVVIELVPAGGELYRWSLGALQWPARAVFAIVAGDVVPRLSPVRLTSDLSDLLTLPAALVILVVYWSRVAVVAPRAMTSR